MADRQHKNRDLWIALGTVLILGGPALTVAIWAVAKVAFWTLPAEIAGGVLGFLGFLMIVAVAGGFWLPGGFIESGNAAALPKVSAGAITVRYEIPEEAEEHKDKLYLGERLSAGQSLWSPDGTVRLLMQHDGNLVVSCGARVLWDSITAQTGDANRLEFQRDGNMVLCTGAAVPLMDWKAAGMGGEVLTLQDDGNLVLYSPGRAIWATDVLKDGRVVYPARPDLRAHPVRLISFPPGNL